ncbi:MAG: ACP phosphodiesterase [Bacteroidota bacterium]
MNFLAHAFLSGEEDKELMVGNFVGDFIKGKQYEDYSKGIQNGVLIHRAIDEYTDTHPVVSQSKDRLRFKYRHYSGVIVDMAYDHFLAANWSAYHDTSLLDFTYQVYHEIDQRLLFLPDRFTHMFSYMKRDNWLFHYAELEGIHRALSGMSRRTTFDSKMEEATQDLQDQYKDFEADFTQFIPDVIRFSAQWLEKNL